MKRILLVLTSGFFATFTLIACNDNTNTSSANNNNASQEDQQTNNESSIGENNEQNEMKQKMKEINFSEFEVEVDYGNDKEYEAEIELDNDHYTADLEDELTGVDIKGKKAFDKIYPHIETLTINQETSKEDAITEILKAFDLDSNYNKFEVEITFNDNTEIEFEDKK